jgi:hypothetical protein
MRPKRLNKLCVRESDNEALRHVVRQAALRIADVPLVRERRIGGVIKPHTRSTNRTDNCFYYPRQRANAAWRVKGGNKMAMDVTIAGLSLRLMALPGGLGGQGLVVGLNHRPLSAPAVIANVRPKTRFCAPLSANP